MLWGDDTVLVGLTDSYGACLGGIGKLGGWVMCISRMMGVWIGIGKAHSFTQFKSTPAGAVRG